MMLFFSGTVVISARKRWGNFMTLMGICGCFCVLGK